MTFSIPDDFLPFPMACQNMEWPLKMTNGDHIPHSGIVRTKRKGVRQAAPLAKGFLGFVFVSLIGTHAFGHLEWLFGGPRFDQVRKSKVSMRRTNSLATR